MDGQSHVLLDQDDVEFLTLLAVRVSAEVERERSIERRLAEERAAAARLEEMNERLLRSAEEKQRFIATVIHDLRQPIAALRTLCAVLQSEDDTEGRAESLGLLDDRVCALSAMVDELMEYAEVEAGKLPRRLEVLSLAEVLRACVAEFEPEAAARDVRLTLDLHADLGASRTDRARLCHIVRNLVGNAIKFSARAAPEGGTVRSRLLDAARVTVSATVRGPDQWELQVRDNGIGMEPEVQRHIFKEFYRAPHAPATEARSGYPQGRGLGLAIVYRLTESLGGTVQVRSRPGRGSCFTLTFPRSVPLE